MEDFLFHAFILFLQFVFGWVFLWMLLFFVAWLIKKIFHKDFWKWIGGVKEDAEAFSFLLAIFFFAIPYGFFLRPHFDDSFGNADKKEIVKLKKSLETSEKEKEILQDTITLLRDKVRWRDHMIQGMLDTDDMVYVCTGESATKYHSNPYCRGLNRCSGEIEEVSVEDAEDMGRTPCHICY